MLRVLHDPLTISPPHFPPEIPSPSCQIPSPSFSDPPPAIPCLSAQESAVVLIGPEAFSATGKIVDDIVASTGGLLSKLKMVGSALEFVVFLSARAVSLVCCCLVPVVVFWPFLLFPLSPLSAAQM